ncbi:MAG TPA: class I SAM-dependent methyltransferase [Burkholderiaceae bacterium]|jgi:methionine biosynthesis protein MetW
MSTPSSPHTSQPTAKAELSAARRVAYTGVRSDIYELVPESAVKVLDLGCADGSLGLALKEQIPGRSVCGVEYSPTLAAAAAAKLDHVIHGDLSQPETLSSLRGGQFDCAICADVLEHLQHPEALLQSLRHCLAPNAALIVSLPNVRHISAFASIFLRGSFPRRQRGIFDDTHWRWFTVSDGRRLVTEAGFAVQQANFMLRWGDQGGGRANKLLNRFLAPAAPKLAPVREFLSYQFVMRASMLDGTSELTS